MDSLLDKNLITTREAAELSGYHSDYLGRLCREGKILGSRVGRSWVIDRSSLLTFVGEQEVQKKKNAEELARTREAEYKAVQATLTVQEAPAAPVPVMASVPVAAPAPAPVRAPVFEESVPSPYFSGRELREKLVAAFIAILAINIGLLGAHAGIVAEGARVAVKTLGNTSDIGTLALGDALKSGAGHLTAFRIGEEKFGSALLSYLDTGLAVYKGTIENAGSAVASDHAVAFGKGAADALQGASPNQFADSLVRAEIAFGTALIESSNAILHAHEQFAIAWAEGSQAVPPRLIAGFYNTGSEALAFTVELPANVRAGYDGAILAWIDGTQNLAERVVRAELAFGTPANSAASDTLATLTSPEGARGTLAALFDARITTPAAERPALAAASTSGGLFAPMRSLALFTYETLHGFFTGAGRTLAAIFSPNIAYAPAESSPSPASVTTVIESHPTTSYVSNFITNPVTYVYSGTGGATIEYVQAAIDRVRRDVGRRDSGNSSSGGLADLSGSSIEDLADVAAMTKSFGDVLLWDGSTWTNVATSSLGIGAGSGSPGGAVGTVQYNNAGLFAGDAAFTFDSTAARLSVSYASTTGISSAYASTTLLRAGTAFIDSLSATLATLTNLVATNSTTTNATTTNLAVMNSFALGSDSFTDLTGPGLVASSGALAVDDVTPSMLQAADFGSFTCNGTNCSLDAGSISDTNINFGSVTLADFTNDAGFLTSAITSVGPAGSLQTGSAITLATTSTAFNGLTASTTITAAGNVITFANTLSGKLGVAGGGTGTSTAPSYGQLLVGDGSGGYALLATSSLGISGGGGTPGGASGQVQFNNSGTFAGNAAFTFDSAASRLSATYASTTAFSSSYASSTNLFAGNLTLGALTGILKASSGIVSVATAGVDYLTSAITSIGPAGQGQTGSSITIATSTSGTDFTITGAGNTLTFSIPSASATNRGLLTSADWSSFNNKISSTSLSATAPLTYNSGSGVFAITQATTGADGYVSSTDFNTFNNKVSSSSLSGASVISYNSGTGVITTAPGTFAGSGTYTFPAGVVAPYASSTAFSSGYASSTNAFFGNLSVGTFSGLLKGTNGAVSAATAGTDYIAGGAGAATTTLSTSGVLSFNANPVVFGSSPISLSITQAGTGASGYLSQTDFNTFNNKISSTSLSGGTGISYNSSSGVITNTAPDQTVTLSAGSGISVSGTYPGFTISNTGLLSYDAFTHPSANVFATTSGALFTASSTIGNGSATGGLTISGNATTTGNARLGSLTLANITGSTQCLHVDASGNVTGTGSDCGSGSGSISAIGPAGQTQNGSTITFATSTTGSDFTITGAGNTLTFNLPSASSAVRGLLSIADWNLFNNKISSTSLSGGTGISYNSGTGVITNTGVTSVQQTGGGSAQTGAITFATSSDTNLGLNITNTGGAFTFTPTWTGTLAAGRLNANVVQGVTNDTNVTGSISAQNLTLGWTGTLSVARGGTGWGNIQAGAIPYGAGTGALATTTQGTGGFVLAWANGVPTWVATSSINNGVTSVQQTGGGSVQTGAITFATSSVSNNGVTLGLTITNTGGAFTFAPTRSGTLTVAGGGTGTTTAPSGQVLYGGGGVYQSVATTTFTPSAEFTTTGTIGALLGGANSTLGLATNGVALTKLAQIAANTILGNPTGATGNVQAFATSTLFGTGTGGQVLTWNNGVAQWVATTTYSAPLVFSAGNVTITQSGTGANGYLSSTDFNTFNNKISSTSLSGGSVISYNSGTGVITTTGGTFGTGDYVFPNKVTSPYASSTALSSAYASSTNLFAGNFTLGALTGILKASSGIVSVATAGVDYLTSAITSIGPAGQGQTGASITLATSTSGTDFTITAAGNAITFNLPSASATARGLLTLADYTTFQNKVSSTSLSGGTGISYNSGTGVITNTGVTSNVAGTGINVSGATGAVTITNTGVLSAQQSFGSAQTGALTFATSSNTTNGLTSSLSITNSGGTFTFTPSLSGTLTAAGGGTGQNNYATGDLLYADSATSLARLPISTNGLVLKLVGGVPSWQPDITTGGGGGAGAWSTTTDSLAIYPSDTSDVIIIGASATTTTSSILEVFGRSYFSNTIGIATTSASSLYKLAVQGNALLSGNLSAANITATGTATVGNLTIGTLTGVLKAASGVVSTATAGVDFENSLSFIYPLVRTVDSISLAFGTTTANIWGPQQTFTGLFATNASSTNATTSSLYITGLTSGGLAVDGSGQVYKGATTTAGTGLTYSGNAFSVNTSQNITTLSNLTSNGLIKTSGGTGALSVATAGTDYIAGGAGAATTTLSTSGALSFSTNPVVFGASPITLSLGTVPVANGGTGWAAIQTGALLYGNGTNALSTTTQGTGGQVLAWLNGIPTWTATSSINNGLSSIGPAGSLQSGPAVTLATSSTAFNGLTASTTITASGNLITFTNTLAGLLGVAGGGTGSSTPLGGILTGNGTGAITSATVSAPLTFSGNTLAITQATTGANGYLSSTDFNTFNNKISSTSLSAAFPLAYNSSTGAFTFNGLSTSTNAVVGNIPYFSGANTFANVATTSHAFSGAFSITGTLGALIGGSNSSVDLANNGVALTKLAQIAANTILGNSTGVTGNVTAFATSSLGIALSDTTGTLSIARGGTGSTTAPQGQILYGGASSYQSVATSSVAAGTGVSFTGTPGALVGGTALTINNTGLLSLQQLGGGSAQTGAITFATSSDTNLGLNITNTGGAFTFTPTWTGTLAAGRLNANVVQGVTNDTNVTGSISAQNLTLGWTGTLSVARGGTGWGNIQAGAIPYGAGTGALATTTQGTGGFVLAWANGVPTWVATSSINNGITAIGPVGQQVTSGAVTLASSTAGTDFTITGSGNTLTFNLPSASLSNRGLLTATDFSTFNNKISSTSLSAAFPLAYNSSTGAFTYGGLSTSTNAVVGNIPYFSGVNTFANVATTTFTPSGEFTTTGTIGALIGGSNSTLGLATNGVALTKLAQIAANTILGNATGATGNVTAVATSSLFGTGTGGQTLTWNNGVPQWVSTTTAGTGLTYNAGAPGNFSVNTSQNISTLSNLTSNGLIKTSGGTGALSIATAGTDYIAGGAGAATSTVTCSGTASCTGFVAFAASPITITGSGLSTYDAWTHPNTLGYSATTSVMGIGTTTPQWALTIASSTRPQLTLSDGSLTSSPYNFRSINGNFYLSTSSPTTFATSSAPVIAVTTNGDVTLAHALTVFPNGTTGANTLFDVGSGQFTVNPNGVAIGGDQTPDAMLEVIGGQFLLSSDSAAGNNGNRLSFDSASGFNGIGTTTPQWALTIASSTKPQLTLADGSATAAPFNFRAINNSLYLSTSSPTTFATTTSSILTINNSTGSTTALKLDVSGTATSSFGGGINLATGCFSVNNVCVGTGSGLSSYDAFLHQATYGTTLASATTSPLWAQAGLYASSTVAFGTAGKDLYFNASNGFLGIATNTPWAQFSVNPTALGSGIPEFAIGSSTATHLVVTGAGLVGIGTAAPAAGGVGAILDVNGGIQAAGGSGYGLSGNNNFAVLPTRLSFQANGLIDTRGSGSASNVLQLGVNQVPFATLTASGNFGVGTATPQWTITAASSTGPQLALTDGSATASPFNFRAINNSLYLSTSSPTTFATTTSSILTINNSTGSTSALKLDVTGTATSSFGGGIFTSGGLTLGSTLNGILKATNGAVTGTVAGTDYVAGGTGANTQVSYFTGTGAIAGDAGMTYDATADRLTVTYASSTAISTTGTIQGAVGHFGSAATNYSEFGYNGTTNYWSSVTVPSAIFSGGNERVRFDIGGNVGIASTSPWGLLSVNPNALGSGVPEFVVGSSSATHLVVTGAGNVGIGTAAPTAKLQVVNTSAGAEVVGLQLTNGSNSANTGITIDLDSTGAGVGVRTSQIASINSGASATNLVFRTSNGAAPAEAMRITNIGLVGIGSTTPWKLLSVGSTNTGTFAISTSTAGCAQFSAFGELYSTGSNCGTGGGSDPFLHQITYGVTASATSTPLWAQSGLYASSTVAFGTAGKDLFFNASSGFLGIGSTSPWGQLSVNPNALGSGVPEFVVGSSTATHLVVTGAGYVGIGTTSPGSLLYVAGAATNLPTFESEDASVTGMLTNLTLLRRTSGTATNNIGARLVFQIENDSGALNDAAYIDGMLTDVTTGAVDGALRILTRDNSGTPTERLRINSFGAVGIGTTTPQWALTVASSTAPQLTLTDASATNAPWNFRSINGNLYISTSSPTTFATTTMPAMTLLSNGRVGFGTSSPYSTLTAITPSSNIQLTIGRSGDFVGKSTLYANSVIALGVLGDNPANELLDLTQTGNLGIGSTSPWATLAVNPTAGMASNQFVVGSSTATNLVVTNGGVTGLGTSTPNPLYRFVVNGNSVFSGSNSSLTIENTGGNQWTLQNIDADNRFRIFGGSAERVSITTGGNVGIGTTTPAATAKLTISTSTTPQLTLTDGSATAAPFNFRAISNTLYISTSSPTTFATTTSSIFALDNSTGSTTLQKLFVNGTATSTFAGGLHVQTGGVTVSTLTSCDTIDTDASGKFVCGSDAGAGSGTPGGSGTELQYRNGASFGAVANTAYDGTTLTLPALVSFGSARATTTIANNLTSAWTLATSSTAGVPLISVDTTTNNEKVTIGVPGGDVHIGISGSTANLVFENSAAIKGTGVTTLTFGVAGDTLTDAVWHGIGTTTPKWALTVASSTAPQLTLTDASLTSAPWNFRSINGNMYISTSSPTTFATSTLPAMTFLSNGRVGIGTSSPWATFSVGSSSAAMTGQGAAFAVQNGASTSLMVSARGVVGIGTSTPNASSTSIQLVVGNSLIPTGQSVAVFGTANAIYCFVKPGTGVACTSDARYKKNVTNLVPALDLVSQLRPVTYNWKGEPDTNPTHAGFIAQEVLDLAPDLISTEENGQLTMNYAGLTPYLTSAIQQMSGALNVRGALTGTSTLKSFYTGTTTAAISVDSQGRVGIGTTSPTHTLDVYGDVAAISFVNTSTKTAKTNIAYLDASSTEDILTQIGNLRIAEYRYKMESKNNPLRLGLIAEEAPVEVLSLDGKGVDIYKLSTFTLAGVQALASHVNATDIRVDSLEDRLAALEAAGGGTLSLQSLTDLFHTIGIYIDKGIAQVTTLVGTRWVAAADSAGNSSAGSGLIMSGNTVVEIANPYATPVSQVFITFTSPLEGNWYLSDKKDGSFRVKLEQAQGADVTFDYFIIQTKGQIATSTPDYATSTQPNIPAQTPPPAPPATTTPPTSGTTTPPGDTAPPIVSVNGGAAVDLLVGDSWSDPGAIATDGVDGDVSASITVSGSVDTGTAGSYTLTYTATDAAGNQGQTTRTVTVAAPAPPPSEVPPAPEAPPAPPEVPPAP